MTDDNGLDSLREALPAGALPRPGGGTLFRLWAPACRQVDLHLTHDRGEYRPLERASADGYWELDAPDIEPGARYKYRLDGKDEWPDPASFSQPDGVHESSEVIAPAFDWEDAAWAGIPLRDYSIYELHVGTFTTEGTFDAVIPYLPYLKQLGITAIELMPVAQFPGARNWGYDVAYPFAVQASYGGAAGLKRLVNAAHRQGLAVVLDVVYNHLGPEGNYLWAFGPYFTDRYQTPWGPAINFDGPQSDGVRQFFLQNALRWLEEFHIDALRLDAIHAIYDFSAYPFLRQLSEEVREINVAAGGRFTYPRYLIGESDQNDPRVLDDGPASLGLDAQWSDDFHHALHTLLTSEKHGYYEDFGDLEHLRRCYNYGWSYGSMGPEFSPHRRRTHGNLPSEAPIFCYCVCAQNHDQVGNRMLGGRLATLVNFEQLKLAAAATLLSPLMPLLFMGEEYGETAPFQYFVSHGDAGLVEAVRKGRAEEFAAFHGEGEAPDPQSEETFVRSRPRLELRKQGRHAAIFRLYQQLLKLRKDQRLAGEQAMATILGDRVLAVHFGEMEHQYRALLLLNFSPNQHRVPVGSAWKERAALACCTSTPEYGGPLEELHWDSNAGGWELELQPHSATFFTKQG